MYKTVPGAFEASSEDGADSLKTLPHKVTSALKGNMLADVDAKMSLSLPMESIPEDAPAEPPDPGQ